MKRIFLALMMGIAFTLTLSEAKAEMSTIEITVSYRERIALPPDAQLDVQLLDVSRADTTSTRIAAQRFAVLGTPMTITLPYDPQVIENQASYAVVAAIWSGDKRIFRSTNRHDVLGGTDAGPVDVVLSMVAEEGETTTPPLTISGVQWTVTEVAGNAWGNDDPATLLIDGDMNFSLFGGCNRFSGQLMLSDGEIDFPENFAGTLMACPAPAEKLERSYLDALQQVTHYVRYGAGLVLMDGAGNAMLHFRESPR